MIDCICPYLKPGGCAVLHGLTPAVFHMVVCLLVPNTFLCEFTRALVSCYKEIVKCEIYFDRNFELLIFNLLMEEKIHVYNANLISPLMCQYILR